MQIFKKTLKIISFIILGLALLLIMISVFIEPIIKNRIENQINKSYQGQFSATIDEVEISLLRGDFIIKGVQINTDTVTARENKAPVISLDAGEISVEGVSWLKFLLSEKLQVDRASFLDLNFEAQVRNIGSDKTGPFKWEDLDLYPLVKNQVDRAHLSDLLFRNINLTLVNIESNDTLKFNADEFNLQSGDILLDANKVFTDSRTFYASEISIQGKEVKIKRAGNSQWLTDLGIIEFHTRANDINIISEDVLFLKHGGNEQDTAIFTAYRKFNLVKLNLHRAEEDSVASVKRIELDSMKVIDNVKAKLPPFDVSEFSLDQILPRLLDKVKVDEIVLQDINYKLKKIVSIDGLDFSARKTVIDERPAFADNRFLHTEQFYIAIEKANFVPTSQSLRIILNHFNMGIVNGIGNLALNQLTANKKGKAPNQMHIKARLSRFKVLGINARKLTNKVLSIDSIAIEKPTLLVDLGEGSSDSKTGNEVKPNLYPAIEGLLKKLKVNKIALIEGDVKISGIKGNRHALHLPAVYAQISDLLIAEGTAFEASRILHAANIVVRMERIIYPLSDNIHWVKLDLLKMSTREKYLKAYGLSCDHIQNIEQQFKRSETNQVFNLTNHRFLIDNLEYQSLIEANSFFAGSITSDGLDAKVFKNKNFPARETSIPPTPQKMIKSLGLPVYLGEIAINSAKIRYQELAAGSDKRGSFFIDDLNLKVGNLTNVDKISGDEFETVFKVNGKLMGNGYFDAKMVVPMHDQKQLVKVTGKVDSFNLPKLNSYIEYTSPFGIESGTIYSMIWDFKAGKEKAKGQFGMSYDSLQIRVSEPGPQVSEGPLYEMTAYLAEALVLDSDVSERKSHPPKTVPFERKREEGESFTDHYVYSLMQGISEMMGFPLSIIE